MANWRRLPGLCTVIALLAAVPAAALTVTPPTFTAGGLVPAQVRETPVEAMAPQQRRAYIRGIQEALAARGFGPGPANGEIGPQTKTAIRDYQRDAGLPETGTIDRRLLDTMLAADPAILAKTPM